MDVITMQTEAYKKIVGDIASLRRDFDKILRPNGLSEKEKWLTTEEVCRMLNISKRTCKNYRDKGLLPFSKNGAKIYFKESDVHSYLEDRYNK